MEDSTEKSKDLIAKAMINVREAFDLIADLQVLDRSALTPPPPPHTHTHTLPAL
jgi:hypothetical protein